MSSHTQSILFSKDLYDTKSARRWLMHHNLSPIKRVHETTHFLRYRIREPNERYDYRTKILTTGIKAVIGCLPYAMLD